jgi:S-adenosylmethionine:tRNA ribosyltransferase-isomerase
MRTADFDFELPPELIAQVPAERRDASRLLVLDRKTGIVAHENFRDLLNHLRAGDVLVLNNSRVIPARLRGMNEKTGGQFEVLLLEEYSVNDWWVMLRPGKRARIGTKIIFRDHSGAATNISAEVIATNDEGHRRLKFTGPQNILEALDQLGELPLPPYIERTAGKTSDTDLDRYQTVYSQPLGSVAAPTAGLHFTPQLLDEIRACGVQVCFVTLHVGLGTFAPVKADSLAEHVMHEERFEVGEATANTVNTAKREGRRVIAVGTTSVRVLESAFGVPPLGGSVAGETGPPEGGTLNIRPGPGRTRIFIHPPHTFKVVDALLTNFHLPRSTLLMLVSAFTAPGELRGRELALRAYADAVRERYRFFSYGDAMLIL